MTEPVSNRHSPAPAIDRRRALALAGGALGAGLVGQASAQQGAIPAVDALSDGRRFEPANVVELARTLSKRAFTPIPTDMPDGLRDLSYDQYVAIRPVPEAMLWEGDKRGFVLEPLHRGFVYVAPVSLNIVEDGAIRHLAYDPRQFTFDKLKAPEPGQDIGYSGFRLYASFDGSPAVDFAIAQGATFFSAVAKGQSFGISARALMLKPADAKGEEFPFFRAFWIERPRQGQGEVVVHGLIDSPSTTAAIRMTLRPGETSHVDVEGTLFPRTALDHVGIGGMAGAYLFGANDRRNVDDVRGAAHEASGLLIANGGGESLWRPVQNPESLLISAFVDNNPKGFGLMQRTREFAAFQDDDQHWERRPSLWVEPTGPWGAGAVQLIEIPSDSAVNKNILVYWRPKDAVAAGAELPFAYRQSWCWRPPHGPDLATVTTTRTGQGSGGRRRRFLVDFTGEVFAGDVEDTRAVITSNPGKVDRLRLFPHPDRKTMRTSFELDPGNETSSELRLVIERGGRPVSETWLYRWTP